MRDRDNRNEFKTRWEMRCEEMQQRRAERRGKYGRHGHIWTGAFILIIGIAALIKVSVSDAPEWLFSWQSFLILLGLFTGIKHRFKGGTWFVLILVGGAFLVRDMYPDIPIRQYLIPGVLIILGAFIMLKPRHRHQWAWDDGEKKKEPETAGVTGAVPEEKPAEEQNYDTKEDFVDSTSIFGGAKKNIISKNFKGGDLVSIFGGTELDLTRADFKGTAVLELTTIFGGTKLIVPADWTVKSEAVTLFGGLEDKRNVQVSADNPEKILLLKGTVIFGGTEIKSY
jgi:predicted membrane protein